MAKSTEHRDMIVDRFQKELQVLSDYFKKLTTKIDAETKAENRNMAKLRARDRSDMDQHMTNFRQQLFIHG